MVGIILASHGEFAEGIYNSGSMIFGDQVNVKPCILKPSEGPEDIRKKMEEAIASFSDQEQVLFLVDLWGGTPFNQASALKEGHDKWAIVTGLNLPMLIETYASRMSMETAHEIAAHIVTTAREGVRPLPENLEPHEESNTAPEDSAPSLQAIPEGTVLGDGHIKYVLARVDTRLLHGQVATTWTKSTSPDRIIVVSDSVAHDDLRKNMIIQAAPPGVKAHVVPIDKMIAVDKDPRFGATKALLLFETPQDALRAIKGGVEIKKLNIGSMAHSQGKVAVTKALAFDKDDVQTIKDLKNLGVEFDVRKVPADSPEDMDSIIKRAEAELV